jgi:hypothetical protein
MGKNKARDTSGKFAPKSETPRKTRSVNLTDEAWKWLANVAEKMELGRNDFLELLATFGTTPFIEMVKTHSQPIMETVQAENQRSQNGLCNLSRELPEASELLNQLKAKRKKATASLADVEAILEILER